MTARNHTTSPSLVSTSVKHIQRTLDNARNFDKPFSKGTKITQKAPALNSQPQTFVSKKADETHSYSDAVTGLSEQQTSASQNSETKNLVLVSDTDSTTEFISMIIQFSEKYSEILVHKAYSNALSELRKSSTTVDQIYILFTSITKMLK